MNAAQQTLPSEVLLSWLFINTFLLMQVGNKKSSLYACKVGQHEITLVIYTSVIS